MLQSPFNFLELIAVSDDPVYFCVLHLWLIFIWCKALGWMKFDLIRSVCRRYAVPKRVWIRRFHHVCFVPGAFNDTSVHMTTSSVLHSLSESLHFSVQIRDESSKVGIVHLVTS